MPFWTHTPASYSGFAKLLHWLSAVGVFGLFALGFWMVTLDYYHPWYQTGPEWHISLGVLLAVIVVVRLVYRLASGGPGAIPSQAGARWQQMVAHVVHGALYALLIAIFLSGYFVVTAEGDPVPVFNWFELPPLGLAQEISADTAGWVHEISAYVLMGLVVVHALAAIKHHFLDRDGTLMRMISKSDFPAPEPDSSPNER